VIADGDDGVVGDSRITRDCVIDVELCRGYDRRADLYS
jgi:hypothetical protein